MKYLIFIICIFSLVSCKPTSQQLSNYDKMQLDNGLTVYFLKDESLPKLQLSLLVPFGQLTENQDNKGLSSAVTSLMRRGTAKSSYLELAEKIEFLGASFSASAGEEFSSFSIDGLSLHAKELMGIYKEILFSPTFPQKELERIKKLSMDSIQASLADPVKLIDILHSDLLFSESPYGSWPLGSLERLKNLNSNEVKEYYKNHFNPKGSILSVIGQFDNSTKKEIIAMFSEWETKGSSKTYFSEIKPIAKNTIHLIDNRGAPQTQIRMGHISVNRKHPDYLKLKIGALVLGGHFNSRLMKEVRVKRGLSYTIGSYFNHKKNIGEFHISTFTKNKTVGETLKVTRDTVKEFVKTGITEQDLTEAKAFLKGTFPRILETSSSLAKNLMVLNFYGVSETYLLDFYKSVDAISLADVNTAIAKYIRPDELAISLIGPRASIKSQLSGYNIKTIKPKSLLE